MSSGLTSFLRDCGKQYILYLSVGLAAIPVGITYGILAVNGYGSWWTLLPSVVLASWLARKMWRYVKSKVSGFGYGFMASGKISVDTGQRRQAGIVPMGAFFGLIEGHALTAQYRTRLNSASQTRPLTNVQPGDKESVAEPYVFAGN
jgi:hypothetical protein